jgi:3-phosphoshikimate 1-carboxyvinyltransferase
MLQQVYPGKYNLNIQVPASKSDGQRALLAAALSKGTSYIHQLGNSKDELAMLRCIEQLGAKTSWNEEVLEVEGLSTFPSEIALNCGESGLTSRLLIAVCAMYTGNFSISGEGSLLQRSMDFYVDLFHEQQLTFTFSENNTLPLQVRGGIKAGEIVVDGSQSSQYISGLLMGLPLLASDSILVVENGVSLPYIQMTLNTLTSFGIIIKQLENRYYIQGNQTYRPATYVVEGDWSSASYWLVASALGQDIQVKGLSFESLQADKAILEAFESANCTVVQSENGLQIHGNERKTFIFDATHCPDLFPALAVLAVLTPGISMIKGVHRLQNKESDRGKVLQAEFEKLGVRIDLEDDVMHIHGQASISGGTINAHNDHRIAMCFGVLGMSTTTPIIIDGAEAVIKSYPRFWEEMINGNVTNQVTIRSYNSKDKKELIELLRLNTPAFFATDEENDFIEYLNTKIQEYFILELENRIIGCGGINYRENNTIGVLSWDMIHPDFQYKGHGTLLVKHRIDRLLNKNSIKDISVRTSQHTYKFYEKSGFELIKIIKDYWSEGYDLFEMRYKL